MTEDHKKAYQQKAEAQIKAWEQKMNEFKSKIDLMSADARVNLIEKLGELKRKTEQAKMGLDEVKNSTQQNWETTRDKIEGMLEATKNAVDDIASKIKGE